MTNEQQIEISVHDSYLTYKRKYDYYNGTDYAKQHYEKYVKHVERAEQTETVEPIVTEQIEPQRVTYNDGKQRNIIGNMNDNETVITKCFNHLNAMKRAQTLLQQSNDEYAKLLHENIMYRERDALELTLRTLQMNIKSQK